MFLKPSKPIKTEDQNQIKPIKRIYPSNANQTHHQSEPPPTPPSSHIKPTVDQPIKPTTEFQNQETKTLDLHKIKLHGRKRKEAPPCAYRKEREREREREWFRSRDHAPHLFFQLVLGTPSHWASKT